MDQDEPSRDTPAPGETSPGLTAGTRRASFCSSAARPSLPCASPAPAGSTLLSRKSGGHAHLCRRSDGHSRWLLSSSPTYNACSTRTPAPSLCPPTDRPPAGKARPRTQPAQSTRTGWPRTACPGGMGSTTAPAPRSASPAKVRRRRRCRIQSLPARPPAVVAAAPVRPSRPPPHRGADPARGNALVALRTRNEISRAFEASPGLFPEGATIDTVMAFMSKARVRGRQGGKAPPLPLRVVSEAASRPGLLLCRCASDVAVCWGVKSSRDPSTLRDEDAVRTPPTPARSLQVRAARPGWLAAEAERVKDDARSSPGPDAAAEASGSRTHKRPASAQDEARRGHSLWRARCRTSLLD